jgi:hypothetical protein
MKIGDVSLPCVFSFDAAAAKKDTETIYPLGTDLHFIAEFGPEPVSMEALGVLIKLFSGTKTADEYAEDLEALASRKSVFNYMHEVQGLSGFLVIEKCDVDPRKSTQAKRDFSFSGKFLPLAQYQGRIDSVPVVLSNSYGITLEDCENWVQIPRLSEYQTAGNTRELDSEYGTLVQASESVYFSPTAEQDGTGEIRVYDGSTRIYSSRHRVSGKLTVSNGLYQVTIDSDAGTITVSYWSGSEYTKIDDFEVQAFSGIFLRTCRPDLVEVLLSSGDTVLLEAGRVPMINTESLTCSEISPAEQSTDAENYLVLDDDIYVASTQEISIADGVISGPGKKWIFYEVSDAAQEAKNCLVDSQMKWFVGRRW